MANDLTTIFEPGWESTVAELDAVLYEWMAKTDQLRQDAARSDEEHERWKLRVDALGRRTDENLAILAAKLNNPK